MIAQFEGGIDAQAFEIEDCLGAALIDRQLTILDVSSGVRSLGGYRAGSLIGRSALDVVHPDDAVRASDALFESMSIEGPSPEGMYRLRFFEGTYEQFSVAATCLGPDHDYATIFQFRPVPLVLRAEEFARDAVDVMRLLAESQPLGTSLERVHRLAERHIPHCMMTITTIDADRAEQRSHRRDGESFISDDSVPVCIPDHVHAAFAEHQLGPWRAFNRMASFEPSAKGSRVTSVLSDEQGRLLGYVEVIRAETDEPSDHEWMVHGLIRQVLSSVLQRLRLDAQLREVADRDYLTGLFNRRRLFEDMESHGDLTGTSLLMIDLDRFSWINNTLGHHVGDQALVALADCLRSVCPEGATITRFGGDEFVIWLPTGTGAPGDIADAIRDRQIVPEATEDMRAHIRCSIGAVTIRAGEAPNEAIRRADEAMYVAKRRGGDALHHA